MDWLKALLEALGKVLFGSRRPPRDFRVKTSLQSQVTDKSGNAMDARVSNLSSRGLKIATPGLLHKDEELLVQVQGSNHPYRVIALRARVVWCKKQGRGYEAGLQFISFHNTQYDDVVQFFREEVKLEVHETAARLRSPRQVLHDHPLRFSPFGNLRSIKGVVENISATGLRFHSEEPVDAGTVLHLTVDLGPKRTLTLICTVRRCSESKKGPWDVAATLKPADEYNAGVLDTLLAPETPQVVGAR